MDLEIILTPGLGNATYLLASDGEVVVVDPPRDAWRVTAVADARGWRLTHVVETHVHNDYLSGALELRAARRAEIVAPARGRYAFEHRGADEGDSVEIGDLRLVARAVPWFVIGFVVVAGLRSAGLLDGELWGDSLAELFQSGATVLILVALAGVGISTDVRAMLGVGARPFLLGASMWVVIGLLGLVLAMVLIEPPSGGLMAVYHGG